MTDLNSWDSNLTILDVDEACSVMDAVIEAEETMRRNAEAKRKNK
jgi:hypothetical protein